MCFPDCSFITLYVAFLNNVLFLALIDYTQHSWWLFGTDLSQLCSALSIYTCANYVVIYSVDLQIIEKVFHGSGSASGELHVSLSYVVMSSSQKLFFFLFEMSLNQFFTSLIGSVLLSGSHRTLHQVPEKFIHADRYFCQLEVSVISRN